MMSVSTSVLSTVTAHTRLSGVPMRRPSLSGWKVTEVAGGTVGRT